ncbi:ABC transporter ATP-binding protein [Streptomyces sp. NBC_01341]|uniref:ABC transporter ATP-binding protein n=1 Tax=Streptomyces sp. NBC_01341 TaxID=2903831 RepID=UPI002E12E5B0|nr:ABC transporter ATP-binding protein [Streptomyces sp. NBC_01341]
MPSPISSPDAVLAAHGVTQTYRRGGRAVLDGCTFTVPAGVVSALVGPNGAGKSTLLELAAGMRRPVSGAVEVFGGSPRAGHPRVAYLAQHRPLFPRFTVAETMRLGARLNGHGWDAELAGRVLGSLHDRLDDRVGDLSGGERTRVSLALTLGKGAGLLLLDEPMADLDVLARQDVMGLLMAHVADTGATVVMSSHIISELADVCDHLLLLQEGTTRLCGGIDELTAAHAVVALPGGSDRLAGHTVVESRPAGRGTSALVRPAGPLPAEWDVRTPSLDELVLAHLTAAGATGPALAPTRPSKENAA